MKVRLLLMEKWYNFRNVMLKFIENINFNYESNERENFHNILFEFLKRPQWGHLTEKIQIFWSLNLAQPLIKIRKKCFQSKSYLYSQFFYVCRKCDTDNIKIFGYLALVDRKIRIKKSTILFLRSKNQRFWWMRQHIICGNRSNHRYWNLISEKFFIW